MMDAKQHLEELLLTTAQQGATDLHLSPGHYPTIRIDGRLIMLSQQKILDKETLEGLVFALLDDNHKARFLSEKELDFSYELEGKNRFRVDAYQTKGGLAASLRLIPNEVKSIDELNLPQITKIFSKLSQGFVLVVGPNGHGKSTTLAAIIDTINKERAEKIVTIEDPIEYIFSPDETMSAVVTAAETGHLVLTSLHTNSASQTIERIIDSFPPSQESQIRNQLANTISGIISQRLIPRIKGGLIPAVEIMIANPAIRTLIRDNRPRQLDLVIETSQESGMISLNCSLADLVRRKEISLERAQFYSQNPSELKELIR